MKLSNADAVGEMNKCRDDIKSTNTALNGATYKTKPIDGDTSLYLSDQDTDNGRNFQAVRTALLSTYGSALDTNNADLEALSVEVDDWHPTEKKG